MDSLSKLLQSKTFFHARNRPTSPSSFSFLPTTSENVPGNEAANLTFHGGHCVASKFVFFRQESAHFAWF